MGVHDGHRQRTKQRYLDHGLENFNDVNALELLLYYAIPMRDTNPLAHALIERFGSLSGVLSASVNELKEVEGVGESTALLITLIPQLIKKSMISDANEVKYIKSSADAGAYLLPRFMFEDEEVFMVMCLDGQRRVICCKEMSRGVINAVETSNRRVVELALNSRASYVILAHNHPDGLALPSENDKRLTKEMLRSLKLVGVQLTDHIIVAGDDYVSFADSGMMLLMK